MLGGLLAGAEETPGIVYIRDLTKFIAAWVHLAQWRGLSRSLFQSDVADKMKLVPEGVEGRVPYKGSVAEIILN